MLTLCIRAVAILLAPLTAFAGCSTLPTTVVGSYEGIPVLRDKRPKFILVSWLTPAQNDAFAVFSTDEQMYRFLDGFRPTAPHITFAALEQRIAAMPKKCLVSWTADPHHNIGRPRPELQRRVKALTDRRGIDLQFNAIITEDTGI